MDVFMHCGAHRCATTSFQSYLQARQAQISGQSIAIWGPWRTRNGILHKITEKPVGPRRTRRAAGRVRLNLDATFKTGMTGLLVSDENLIGTPRNNLRYQRLYPQIGERMARAHAGFGSVRRIVLQIRSLETYWASLFAHVVARGDGMPSASRLETIATARRSWRHVITDLACACPDTEIVVAPFERFSDRPDRLFAVLTSSLYPPHAQAAEFWNRKSPDLLQLRAILMERGPALDSLPDGEGRWQPFDTAQAAALRETYADDVLWLRAGADGLARFTEEPEPDSIRNTGAFWRDERGHSHESHARDLAPPR